MANCKNNQFTPTQYAVDRELRGYSYGVRPEEIERAIAAGWIEVENGMIVDRRKADAALSAMSVKGPGMLEAEIRQAEFLLRRHGVGEEGKPLTETDVKDFKDQQASRKTLALTGQATGKLVDGRKVLIAITTYGRVTRDAILNLPARVAADLAAELDVDAHAFDIALGEECRKLVLELQARRVH